MAIPDYAKENFETLKKAFAAGEVALLECTKNDDSGELIDVICAVNREDGAYEFVPFALVPREVSLYDLVRPPEMTRDDVPEKLK